MGTKHATQSLRPPSLTPLSFACWLGRAQDFSEFGELIYAKYFRGCEKNSNFKAGIKAIVRAAAAALSTHELKARALAVLSAHFAVACVLTWRSLRVNGQDLESSVIAVRNQKLKEEKEAQTKGKKSACPWGRVCVLGVLTRLVLQLLLPRASRA